VLPVDLTSTWIPLSLLAVLCAYMFVLFQRERRSALAFEGPEAAPAAAHGGGHSAPAPEAHPEPVHAAPAAHAAPVHAASEEKPKRRRLLWRTAFIWLPFVAGFAAQAYLDIIKPLVEKTAG
jgi:hypothetical protein